MLAPPHAEGLAPPPTEILDLPLDVYCPIIGYNYRIVGGGGGGQVWPGGLVVIMSELCTILHDFVQSAYSYSHWFAILSAKVCLVKCHVHVSINMQNEIFN